MMRRQSACIDRKWIDDSEYLDPQDLQGEEWKRFEQYQSHPLPSGYQISSKGRVKRLDGTIFKGSISSDGYHEIQIEGLNIRVHRAVLQIFAGSSESATATVHHRNHNKLDNRIENLQWLSAFENNQEGHGVRCKIVDQTGEHIFPSQVTASLYIGRHRDYISEGIKNNYKLTDSQGKEIEVYFESEEEWVRYRRKMPSNRNWCKIINGAKETEFESFQECSRFLGLADWTIGNAVRNSWPLPDAKITLLIWDNNTADYVKYSPTSKKKCNVGKRCVVTDSTGSHEFRSISKAAQYIERDPEYLRIVLKEHREVKDSKGQVVVVEVAE